MRSGRRRSSSRATATAADRTWYESHRGCEPDVDVQAAVAGRLRVPGDAELVEQRLQLGRGLADVREVGAGLRVEVDAQLVGVRRGRPRGTATRGSRGSRGSRPRRRGPRSAATSARDVVPFGVLTIVVCSHSGASSGTRFWKNDGPPAPFGKPLHQHRPAAHRAHQRLGEPQVVADEVELGLARARGRTPCPGW